MNGSGKHSGFSLAEVVVAVFVIGVAMITFIPCFVQGRASVRKSQRIELAAKVANAEIEKWRHAGYSGLPTIPAGKSSVTQSLSVPNPLPKGGGQIKFQHVNTSLAATTVDTGLEQMDATVSWDDTVGDHGSVTINALISK